MTSGRRCTWFLFAATLLLPGCTAYRYMRDPTADIEKSRRDYSYNNPGNRYNGDIENGRIRVGMSRLQVRVTWGDPDRVARNGGSGETWSYDETDASRGSSVFMLRFNGELLAQVDVQRAALQLPTNSPEKARTNTDDKDLRPKSGVKPGR